MTEGTKRSENVQLRVKTVGDLFGYKFCIPSYQRGYRWTKREVERLVEDLDFARQDAPDSDYLLQPIAVIKNGSGYELVDGQQRLTTLFLLVKVLVGESPFVMEYATRESSGKFLENPVEGDRMECIDYYFIRQAYETLHKYFECRQQQYKDTYLQYLKEKVKVIWYEVPSHVKGDGEEDALRNRKEAVDLFSRLNSGKISLTNAELVRALFLSALGKGNMGERRQAEVAYQWDYIERELHHMPFWCFLMNPASELYPTRMDLVLELAANTQRKPLEQYHTFFLFEQVYNNQRKCGSGMSFSDMWDSIYHTFQILKSWYEDDELYHKIGYLVAAKGVSELRRLYKLYTGRKSDEGVVWKSELNGMRKHEFRDEINNHIREIIKGMLGERKLEELTYENAQDRDSINKLLLLVNVETVRRLGDASHRFPFDKHKRIETWSLEHIHAQNSEGLNSVREWCNWLENHREYVKSTITRFESKADGEEKAAKLERNAEKANGFRENAAKYRNRACELGKLEQEMANLLENSNLLNGTKFQELFSRVINCDQETDEGKMNRKWHTLDNMALLGGKENSSLNKAVFSVKRRRLIDKEKGGDYIPLATMRVFLKYDNPDGEPEYWEKDDGLKYIASIKSLLREYCVID